MTDSDSSPVSVTNGFEEKKANKGGGGRLKEIFR